MSDYRELLIGCGARREKFPFWALKHPFGSLSDDGNWFNITTLESATYAIPTKFENLTTLDINEDHTPDLVSDLSELSSGHIRINGYKYNEPSIIKKSFNPPLSTKKRDYFFDPPISIIKHNYFDEIHAYEVLEHIGAQGDYKLFFAQFTEFHRILKPGGFLFATCPSWCSPWAWGDPSHQRVITAGTLSFLSQKEYDAQVGKTTMSDFRYLYKADFRPLFISEDSNALRFVLRAIK